MKFTGLTEEALLNLSVEDIDILKDMIGCEVEYSITEPLMLIMPDGELTHEMFLILE